MKFLAIRKHVAACVGILQTDRNYNRIMMTLYEAQLEPTRQLSYTVEKDEIREGCSEREDADVYYGDTTESMTEHQIINWQEKKQLQTSDRV